MDATGEILQAQENGARASSDKQTPALPSESGQGTPQLTSSSNMVVIDDDTILHPFVDDDTLLYIACLDEGHEVYTRFFDALLIKRQSHRAFFRDLKAFREQLQPISLLQRAKQDKQFYKDVTLVFLGSRYAHPWCRKTPLKKGFWRSEWGTIEGKKKDLDTAREEDRLHKLLLPLWVIMRIKMFPGQESVKAFCEEERERRQLQKETRLTAAALQRHDVAMDSSGEFVQASSDHDESDEGIEVQKEQEHVTAAHVATSVFRLAAAGMLISKTPKRKLRWLVKKPK